MGKMFEFDYDHYEVRVLVGDDGIKLIRGKDDTCYCDDGFVRIRIDGNLYKGAKTVCMLLNNLFGEKFKGDEFLTSEYSGKWERDEERKVKMKIFDEEGFPIDEEGKRI